MIWLRFNDGAEGMVNLQDELYGEVFEPLKDIERFKSFKVPPDLVTIVWYNGAAQEGSSNRPPPPLALTDSPKFATKRSWLDDQGFIFRAPFTM